MTVQMFLENFEIQNWNLHENTKREISKQSGNLYFVYFIDMLFCYTFIGPAVVAFWRSTWDLSSIWLDHHLCAGDLTLSNSLAITGGLFATLSIDLWSSRLKSVAGSPGSKRLSVVRYIFSLTFGLVNILYWKGIWDGVNHWAGIGQIQAIVSGSIGLIVLSLTSSIKSGWYLPIGLAVDEEVDHISVDTFLSFGSDSPPAHRLLDGILSRMITMAVVLLWHGIWTTTAIMTDNMLLTHEQSGWLSLSIGFIGGLLLFFGQFLLLLLVNCKTTNIIFKHLFYILTFIFNILGVYTTIQSFLGYWYLLDEYLTVSYQTSMVISFLLLIVVRCGSCLHGGIRRDSPSLGLIISFHYVSYFHIRKLEDKNRKSEENIPLNPPTNFVTKL